MTQTLLIGLDGATFTILDALMRDGVMPFLRDLVDSGVRSELRSTVPALTPPAWVSMMTGRAPGEHGIFDFFRRESPQSHRIRFLTAQDVQGDTIWSLASRNGLRATTLNFPLTFPPPPIDGYVVPGGWMPWKQLRLGCHPHDLFDRLKALPEFNPRELAMDMAQEEKAIEGCQRDEYEDWIHLHVRREKQWFEVLKYVMRTDPTEFTSILFDGVDKLQHLCWRFLDPSYSHTILSDWERRVREECLGYFRDLDGLLAQIAELAGPEASIIIASDHGFGPQSRTLFINAWLAERGYLAWTDGHGPQRSESRTVGLGHLARHVYELDWSRTKAYVSMPSGNGIHIVRASEEYSGGVPEAEYELLRETLIQELSAIKDPGSGTPVVAKIWKREEIFAGPNAELAPDLTLELEDGGLMSILASDAVVVPLDQPKGTHRPEGILIARGPLIEEGLELEEQSILDVMPLMLALLGLPIPEDLAGRVPTGALTPAAAGRVSLCEAASVEPSRPVSTPMELDSEAEAEIARRLRALGNIE